MSDAAICDHFRTPTDWHAGELSFVRTDNLAVLPIASLIALNQSLDLIAIDEVRLGCADSAGEDHRNVAQIAGALYSASICFGLPQMVQRLLQDWSEKMIRLRERGARFCSHAVGQLLTQSAPIHPIT